MRLVEAYSLDSGGGSVLGAVAFPAGGQVGSSADRSEMGPLGGALLVGTLAGNPALAAVDENPNAGHAAVTSENALLYGHPLGDGSSYAIEAGAIVRVTDLRHADPGEPLPKIEPPNELPRPLFSFFDDELAHATHGLFSTEDQGSRRLTRAIDWYRIALSNAEAVSRIARVGAVRSALEALTGVSDTKRLVRSVGRLLRDPDTREELRTSRFWNEPVRLTPDEWWLANFSELRNAIVHGDEISPDRWTHEENHHLDLAHDKLLGCLRAVIAVGSGDSLLKLPRRERASARRVAEFNELLTSRSSADGDDDNSGS